MDALGDVLGPLVTAVAESLQVPTDLVINLALPLVSTAARGRWMVTVTPDWSETVALSTVSALSSGERKSGVVRMLSEPLREHERQARSAAAPEAARQEAARRLKSDQVDQLRRDAVRKGDPGTEERYLDAEQELAELTVSVPPRWLADDTTPERLASLLAEQDGALGLVSTEPGLFGILAGRYSNGSSNLEVVLQATAGDPVTIDRQGRPPVHMPRPALSMALCIQPALLPDLGARREFRGSGLLARFLYVLPAPRIGTRSTTTRPMPGAVSARWATALQTLAATPGKHAQNTQNPSDGGSERGSEYFVHAFRELKLDAEASRVLDEFRSELEPKLHPAHGQLAAVADWGSKLPGAVVRIAAALTLLGDPSATAISGRVMADAVRLGEAYTAHAVAAFALVHGRDDSLRRGREVLGWLVKHDRPTASVREMHQGLRGRAWVNGPDDIRNALRTLVDYGHVRREAQHREPGQPGAPSERYELHPCHLGSHAQARTNGRRPQTAPPSQIVAVIETLRERTGKTVDEDHAARVVKQLLTGRDDIRDPERYLVTVIQREVDAGKFLPTPSPPPYRRKEDHP